MAHSIGPMDVNTFALMAISWMGLTGVFGVPHLHVFLGFS
jgi:hypothetical protein